MKICLFCVKFNEICPPVSNWQEVRIGLGITLAPHMRQAITSIAYPVRWRIYVSPVIDVCWTPNDSDNLGQYHVTHWSLKDGRYFADDIFKCIFWNECICILFEIPLKFVRV